MPSSPEEQSDIDEHLREALKGEEFTEEEVEGVINLVKATQSIASRLLYVLLAAILTSATIYFATSNPDVGTTSVSPQSRNDNLAGLRTKVDSLQTAIERIEESQDTTTVQASALWNFNRNTPRSDVDTLRSRVQLNKEQIGEIKSVISEAPLEALKLPLLKDRIKDLDQRLSTRISGLERSTRNLRNLVWTLLAGFITLVGGVLTVVLSSLW